MGSSPLKPPRGTRDFYPEEMRARSWLFARFREVAHRFGFEEVDAPLVEHAELYQRKAGEEIVDQLYHFELHDRHLALRPEFTPSLARMVIARQGALRFPIRWFSIPQCWRYERMTRGRRREHYQWNMDIWGEPSVSAEAELLAAIFTCADLLELPRDALRVRLNSRALLEESLRGGVLRDRPEAFAPLCVIIDKLDKVGAASVQEQLADAKGPVGLSAGEAEDVVALLSVKDLDEAKRLAPERSEAMAELERLFELLDHYGDADRVAFDASVVRGLAYYTGVVFEANDTAGELRAICGGGRYDRLAETLGGKPVTAVGFGFGDAVIHELLADQGKLPELPRRLDAMVVALDEGQRDAAIALAGTLRERGESVELATGTPRLKRALTDADRAGAQRLYWIGAEERERGVARARDLATGEESEHPLEGESEHPLEGESEHPLEA
ncbi:MAG: histidine--tRNA ligase [Myxococcota bacterium]|nr:histidine--tRNA ligase [Myxococcota bacterium]